MLGKEVFVVDNLRLTSELVYYANSESSRR